MAVYSAGIETRFLRRNPVSRPLAPLLILLALILLGFWLRVHNLDAFSFWTDEGLTPARSGYPIAQILRNEIVIQGYVSTDTHPPLYYLIIHVTRQLFGLSDFAFRYPSVLCGVLLIPLLYQLGRRLVPSPPGRGLGRGSPVPSPPGRGLGRGSLVPSPSGRGLGRGSLVPSPPGRGLGRGSLLLGLLVALLTTINPLQIYYSQEARMYTLLVLLATGMSYALWRALMEEKLTQRRKDAKPKTLRLAFFASLRERSLFRWLALYAVLAALAVYTHYTAVFLVAAQALFWGRLLWRAGLRRLIIGVLVVGALAAIPLIPYTLPRLTSGGEANYFPVSPLTVLQDVVRFFHLGVTVDFAQPLVRALNWLALGLLALGVWAVSSPLPNPLPQGEGAGGPLPRSKGVSSPLPNPLPQGEGAGSPLPSPLPPGEGAGGPLPSAFPRGERAGSPLPNPLPQGEGAGGPLTNPLPPGEGVSGPLSRGEGVLVPSPFGRGLVRGWLQPIFLLSWLLAAPLGLIAGSALFKPMYQGVRHIMIGSPAFLLLVGLGIWAIWTWLPVGSRDQGPGAREEERGARSSPGTWPLVPGTWNPLALVPLGFLLLGAAVALLNLYTNPAYAKDDFRAIVRFIETRAGGNDAVVYNNAVLLPLHEHYRLRSDLTVTALPVYPQFATGQEPELAALAGDYRRVWFVTDPPADGRDDDQLIQGWLDANLLEVSDRRFTARTTEARVVGYAAPVASGQGAGEQGGGGAGESADSPLPPCPPAPLLESETLALTCAHIDHSPLSLPTLWVDLWWRGEQPAGGAQLVFTLTGPDGSEQYRRAHPLLRAGDFDWNPAAPNRLSYDLPLPPGLPPGVYMLAVGPEGAAAVALGEVEIASTDTWPAAPERLFADTELAGVSATRPAARWPNGLELAAVVPWDDTVIAGNNLPLTVFWRVGPAGIDLSNVRYRLEVIGGGGAVLRSQEARPGAAWLGGVAPGALLREVTSLYFRPETPPGRYRLRWTLLNVGQAVVEGSIIVEPPEVTP